jgi:hypothetical protein
VLRRLARRITPRLLVVALGLGASGCGKFREISACRGVARDVNVALDEIEALSKKPSPEQEARAAKRYAELAKQLEPRTLGTTRMAASLREYVTVLRATETALRSHSEASKNHDTSRLNEARRELERLVRREKMAVTRIDVDCHG